MIVVWSNAQICTIYTAGEVELTSGIDSQQKFDLFADDAENTAHLGLTDPSSYKGLYAFHKYWGKKPHEVLGFIIDHLTEPGDIVLDPFMGSGTAGRESLLRNRRFIGGDINPCSVLLTRLMLSPPNYANVAVAFDDIKRQCKPSIYDSYRSGNGSISTHYLWDESSLQEVWVSKKGKGGSKLPPTESDISQIEMFKNYTPRKLRPLRFFTNPRINASPNLTWSDVFSGRALRNLELLHDSITAQPEPARSALLLALTASCGQMSRMVFAITGRGKTQGLKSERIEVGSWVIGFWRPKLHFECNVWDCFDRRTFKLLQALRTLDPLQNTFLDSLPTEVCDKKAIASVQRSDCRKLLDSIPSNTISLIVTDPPHSDRIPYLELSEIWNALIDEQPEFDDELVASNAKERNKSKGQYAIDLANSLQLMSRVLKPNGFLVLVFNARTALDWSGLTEHMNDSGELRYVGRFPVQYSAGSVVQDNRAGGLKYDFAMVFTKAFDDPDSISTQLDKLRKVPDWQSADLS